MDCGIVDLEVCHYFAPVIRRAHVESSPIFQSIEPCTSTNAGQWETSALYQLDKPWRRGRLLKPLRGNIGVGSWNNYSGR